MGSKGTQSTVQNTNQTYSANPAIQGAANQAISGAQSAASQPFQMPVAPVAGFNPTQTQAFGEVSGAQGMAQPYYNQANTYFNQAAQPLTAAQIGQFYNPMADNVTKQLQNIYGEQNVQNQGSLTAQAGGVGADRIAVGMADLANQQGLASGQVYSQLYQQALQAAQQQQQMTAQAGTNVAGLGTTAQNTALQGAGALGNSGLQQQQQTQAQLNAPYQNILAQIAYQFQTPQYLAGITGGLAPALGGTTNGQQTTTAPQPSLMSQILGLGTAGAGVAGALGGFGGSPAYGGGSAFSGDAYGGSSANPLAGLNASDYGVGYAEGGATPFRLLHDLMAKGGKVRGYDDGGDTGPAIPGASIPKTNGTSEPIPLISMHPGAGHSGPLTGGIQFSQPQSGQQSSAGSDISSALGAAAKVLPFFLNRGGMIPSQGVWLNDPNSRAPDQHLADGGDVDEPNFNDRFGAAFVGRGLDVTPPKVPLPRPYPGPGNLQQDTSGAVRLDPSAKIKNEDDEPAYIPPNRDATPAAVTQTMLPQAQKPYPDALDRDVGQQFARSPWLSLVKAGAAMASTPGPLGVSIGKGLQAGVSGLETQRTALRSEQELNDKAQELYEKSMEHLDKYNKMTPYERASVTARNKEIDQSDPSKVPGGDSIANRALHSRALSYFKLLRGDVTNINKTDPELLAKAYEMAGGSPQAATVGPGIDAASAIPDPGEGKRQAGKWYIGPSGKPQQWQG